jgi:hypothetical protein
MPQTVFDLNASRCAVSICAAALALFIALDLAKAAASQIDDPSALVIQPPAETDAGTADTDTETDTEPAGQTARVDDPSWPVGSPQMNGTPQYEMIAALAQPGVVGECLPGELKSVIGQIEQRWGGVKVISTHRPGARVRGTGRPSRHANCNAIDFRPAKGTFREVANWLKANHEGGVGTYSGRLNHIHIDNGPPYRWHN